ncbi:hypothetical protein D3C80_1060970 [compost metagenome]
MRVVTENCRQMFRRISQQLFTSDNNSYTGRSQIFLCSGIYHPELINIKRFAQNVARHIRDQWHAACIRILLELSTFNRFVGGNVQISCIFRERQIAHIRNRHILVLFRGCCYKCFTDQFCFFYRFVGPAACFDITCSLTFCKQVHRQHSKLSRSSALKEEHFVPLWVSKQIQQTTGSFVMNPFIYLAAMGHFHNGHSCTLKINKLRLRTFQHF